MLSLLPWQERYQLQMDAPLNAHLTLYLSTFHSLASWRDLSAFSSGQNLLANLQALLQRVSQPFDTAKSNITPMSTLPTESLEDELLVRKAQMGEMPAFDELIRRHSAMVTRILFRFCPNQADLEDLGQEVFLRAFRKLDRWRPEAPFAHWLRKLTYRTAYDFLRRSRRNPLKLLRETFSFGPDAGGSPREEPPENTFGSVPDSRARSQNTELVNKLLGHLDPADQLVLTLQYFEDLSLTEIAQQLNWTHDKTKQRASRAKKKLHQLLHSHEFAREIS